MCFFFFLKIQKRNNQTNQNWEDQYCGSNKGKRVQTRGEKGKKGQTGGPKVDPANERLQPRIVSGPKEANTTKLQGNTAVKVEVL